MRLFCTTFQAIDQRDLMLKEWEGPNIEALTWTEAQNWVDKNKPYLKITGELEREIDTDTGDSTYFQPLN